MRWCTSVIKELDTPYGIETEVEVKQEHSEFKVDEIEKLESGYRIKGTFKCFIYEVNGKHKKKMKGAFVGNNYKGLTHPLHKITYQVA